MTALRPEQDGGSSGFEDAVRRLDDPLNDPLPGQHPSPWFRPTGAQEQEPDQGQGQGQGQAQGQAEEARRRPEPEPEWYDPQGYEQDWYGGAQPATQQHAAQQQAPEPAPVAVQEPEPAHVPVQELQEPEAEPGPVQDDETVALRTADTRRAAGIPPAVGGRAARRKAAKKGGGRHSAAAAPEKDPETEAADGKPLTRVEARAAARAAKPTAGVIASRAVGEVFISIGVLMLLFVTYQLWWSNIRAHDLAGSARSSLEDDWANGKGKPDAFEPGQGFAILYIPKLDVVVPIAEGISKTQVLDKGMVGHYDKDSIPTAMPDAKKGNFGIAGHRNTHGEPFRFINRLEPGDPIVVETQDKYYVYKMANILPQTAPSNTSVLDPVPAGSGFTKPGRYLTLTTCTPEFTSTYRMIVWGKMVEERPRSKGKPDALVE
ncbi:MULTISPECIES: class E sortase [unclassified Streptomyces]|uniref:class E sortase n=1 Tax=unclassified Streptomyces TaxID=2593676 RepID=UPI00278C42E0|nr:MULTISPECIES: class E sortase [unclassified Streptomyces]